MLHINKKNYIWLLLLLVWTILVFAMVIEENYSNKQFVNKMAAIEVKSNFDKDLIYRAWAAKHGGVYVPVTETTPPNPYLEHIQERDIETPSGKKLTLVNPAYMTRQVHEMSANRYGVKGHLASLDPIRPENAPDEWERQALETFETGAEVARAVITIESETYLREMYPMYVEKQCLQCHAQQGYSLGVIRGGISVSVPLKHYIVFHDEYVQKNYLTHLVIWLIGSVLIAYIRKTNIDQGKEIENSLKKSMLSEASLKAKSIALEKTQDLGQIGTWELSFPENVFYWSDQNCRIFGVSSETVLTFETFKEKIHPEDKALVDKAWQDALNKKPYDLEFRLVIDGQEKWVRGKAIFKFDSDGEVIHVLGFTQDITHIKNIEVELQTNKKRFEDIALSMGDWIWEINLDGVYVFSSEKSIDVLGYSHDEVIGKSCFDFMNTEQQITAKRFFAKIVEEKSSFRSYENWNLKKDGERVCLLTSGTPMYTAGGEIIGFRGIDTDITEQKQLQAQAIRTSQLASLGELAAGVAHEINNPNGLINLNASLLKEIVEAILPMLDELQRHRGDFMLGRLPYSELRDQLSGMTTGIIKSSDKIHRIVDDLKSFVRSPDVDFAHIELNEIARAAVRLTTKNIEQATVCFEENYGTDLPYFYGSFQRIEQVLINLLLNACHALPQRSSCLSLVTRFDCERELLQLIVRDEGVGISPEILPKIVAPFFTTRREIGGSGLGLSICSTIIKDHGGHMSFDSHLGEGTTVTVELPIGRQGESL